MAEQMQAQVDVRGVDGRGGQRRNPRPDDRRTHPAVGVSPASFSNSGTSGASSSRTGAGYQVSRRTPSGATVASPVPAAGPLRRVLTGVHGIRPGAGRARSPHAVSVGGVSVGEVLVVALLTGT
jgi:hypothetical protein